MDPMKEASNTPPLEYKIFKQFPWCCYGVNKRMYPSKTASRKLI